MFQHFLVVVKSPPLGSPMMSMSINFVNKGRFSHPTVMPKIIFLLFLRFEKRPLLIKFLPYKIFFQAELVFEIFMKSLPFFKYLALNT